MYLIFQAGNTALTALKYSNGLIFAGFNDGCLKVLQGSKDRWNIIKQATVSSCINSIDYEAATNSVFFGTTGGTIYNSDAQLKNIHAARTGHVTEVVALDTNNGGCIASVEKNGTVFVWKGSNLLASILPNEMKGVEGRAIQLSNQDEIITGFSNGNIVCYNQQGDEMWKILNSHKGGVSALYVVT